MRRAAVRQHSSCFDRDFAFSPGVEYIECGVCFLEAVLFVTRYSYNMGVVFATVAQVCNENR